MPSELDQKIVVALFINDIKVSNLYLEQMDVDEWWDCNIEFEKYYFTVVISEADNGKFKIGFVLGITAEDTYEVKGHKLIKGVDEWKSVNWNLKTPIRSTFPGEPALPRTKIKVTLKLVSGLKKAKSKD